MLLLFLSPRTNCVDGSVFVSCTSSYIIFIMVKISVCASFCVGLSCCLDGQQKCIRKIKCATIPRNIFHCIGFKVVDPETLPGIHISLGIARGPLYSSSKIIYHLKYDKNSTHIILQYKLTYYDEHFCNIKRG